jgi:DMSO/TMAO reductase YedYZ molybdopterin-dependent catalytic subunit
VLRQDLSRRSLLKGGGAALAGLSALQVAGPARAFGDTGGQVIPWLDPPATNPVPGAVGKLLDWEALDSWLTPANNFFTINHYGFPTVDMTRWRLGVDGLVRRSLSLTLDDLKARPRREVTFTLECSGNTSAPFFIGGIGNARWSGTPLASVLERAGILRQGTEVVFWGVDKGLLTIRDNPGVLGPGTSGKVIDDGQGGLDLEITEQFARSMTVDEALDPGNLLCYEMNGVPLPAEHGFPLRLIAPGWYGVANVKWLTRIEVIDQRFAGRFMARDYVSIRERADADHGVWTFNNIKHDRLKSAPAKVTRSRGRYTVMGAAWGAPISDVEVQIDNGRWMPADLDDRRHGHGHGGSRDRDGFAWRFWWFDWGRPASGEHTIRSRAFDADGNMQPPPEDPVLTSRVTYWENNGQIARRIKLP